MIFVKGHMIGFFTKITAMPNNRVFEDVGQLAFLSIINS